MSTESSDPREETRKSWRTILIELELARNYNIPYQLHGRSWISNPVLELILPSLFYIRAVALLDEALIAYLEISAVALPRGYKSTLDGRISYLSHSKQITNDLELHAARKRRNELAHEGSASVSWSELDRCLSAVDSALQQLGFAGARPTFQVKAERSAMQRSDEPGIVGHRDFSVRVLEGDQKAAEWTWRETLHDDKAT